MEKDTQPSTFERNINRKAIFRVQRDATRIFEMWRLIDLGPIDGYTMTNLYEAVGIEVSKGAAPNTVILNHPVKPFINIGYHQLMDKEVNVEYAKNMGFNLVRRTLGGGTILDGPWEQDYFVVVNRSSKSVLPPFQSFTSSTLNLLSTP